jgi:cytochrome c-type biogenesis protein CcmH
VKRTPWLRTHAVGCSATSATFVRLLGSGIAALVLASSIASAQAPIRQAVSLAADPAAEARMMAIAANLRCLVCQNQTIADSHADLAVDLRQEMREMIARGDSDAQIREFMTARYGDFVLYRPPLKASTLILWFGPSLLLAIALVALLRTLRRRAGMDADAFDPETHDEDNEEATA